jgi:hypothetical protein
MMHLLKEFLMLEHVQMKINHLRVKKKQESLKQKFKCLWLLVS